jgi:hypothetical protein
MVYIFDLHKSQTSSAILGLQLFKNRHAAVLKLNFILLLHWLTAAAPHTRSHDAAAPVRCASGAVADDSSDRAVLAQRHCEHRARHGGTRICNRRHYLTM